jgi:hypothetical protein
MAPGAERRVLVFARAPRAGHVKTRLAASIGAQAALDVYLQLCEIAFSAATQVASTELWLDGDPADPGVAPWMARHGMTLHRQDPAHDLGLRMRLALEQALSHGARRAVLIGSDCPFYDAAMLESAFAALDTAPMVFGPAWDGGYVLVGARERVAPAFEGIDWGSERVMAQTRSRLLEAGVAHAELSPTWDVDTDADLQRWRAVGE